MSAGAVREGRTVRVRLQAPLPAPAARRLVAEVAALLAAAQAEPGPAPRMVCEFAGAPDLGVVDVLGRLTLLAARTATPLEVLGTAPAVALLALAGLALGADGVVALDAPPGADA